MIWVIVYQTGITFVDLRRRTEERENKKGFFNNWAVNGNTKTAFQRLGQEDEFFSSSCNLRQEREIFKRSTQHLKKIFFFLFCIT